MFCTAFLSVHDGFRSLLLYFELNIISSPQRGLLPPGKLKKWKRKLVFIFTCQMVLSFLSFSVTFYSQSVLILLNQWQSVKLVLSFDLQASE